MVHGQVYQPWLRKCMVTRNKGLGRHTRQVPRLAEIPVESERNWEWRVDQCWEYWLLRAHICALIELTWQHGTASPKDIFPPRGWSLANDCFYGHLKSSPSPQFGITVKAFQLQSFLWDKLKSQLLLHCGSASLSAWSLPPSFLTAISPENTPQ